MMRRIILYMGMIVLIGIFPLNAQMTGNPVGVQGAGDWSVGASAGILRHGEGDFENYTKRIVLESRYGLSDWLDVFAIGGGFHVKRELNLSGIENYNGNYTLGYGGGFNLTKSEILNGKANLCIGGYFVRYPSKGEYAEYFQFGGGWVNQIEYDTREYQVQLALVFPIRQVNFYMGAVGWGLQRIEDQALYLMDDNNMTADTPYSTSDGTYQTGLWTGGLLGLEVNLPQQFSIGVEFVGFNEKNYHILIGISQTGGSTW